MGYMLFNSNSYFEAGNLGLKNRYVTVICVGGGGGGAGGVYGIGGSTDGGEGGNAGMRGQNGGTNSTSSATDYGRSGGGGIGYGAGGGGGGAGASRDGSGTSSRYGGSGGGSGGCRGQFTMKTVLVTSDRVTVTVGARGMGGSSTQNGGNGGTSSFGSYASAKGGIGGKCGGTGGGAGTGVPGKGGARVVSEYDYSHSGIGGYGNNYANSVAGNGGGGCGGYIPGSLYQFGNGGDAKHAAGMNTSHYWTMYPSVYGGATYYSSSDVRLSSLLSTYTTSGRCYPYAGDSGLGCVIVIW